MEQSLVSLMADNNPRELWTRSLIQPAQLVGAGSQPERLTGKAAGDSDRVEGWKCRDCGRVFDTSGGLSHHMVRWCPYRRGTKLYLGHRSGLALVGVELEVQLVHDGSPKWFAGKIVSFEGMYEVQFEDGDSEKYTFQEFFLRHFSNLK